MGEFAFQTGDWQVHHRKLTTRLQGADDWVEFQGTCRAWEVMDGAGNVEDQFLDDPSGPYRASALRRRAPDSDIWSIWWFDGRFNEVDPPVQGRFEDGIGRFYAQDTFKGRPIRVRFTWSGIEQDRAQWEQAFSLDDGATWETNWIMTFRRKS